MMLLGVDVGTTHCKAGLVGEDGALTRLASRPTESRRAPDGIFFYEPEALWQTVAATIREVTEGVNGSDIAAVGIASMAETGLLVDGATGEARSHLVPWFDTRAMAQTAWVARESDAKERFGRTGLHGSYKFALPKLLWLREQGAVFGAGTVWLSTADYVAYRLTERMATDYTLAARTFLFDVGEKRWDEEWIRGWGFGTELFPEAVPSGQPVGTVRDGVRVGLREGTPVAISGHDHLCAALAVGAVRPGVVFDSMGTAEAFMGTTQGWRMDGAAFRSGLTFGRHVVPERFFWLGGLSASGGSVEWARQLMGEEPLSYEAVERLLDSAGEGPTGILYFPYLSGSGAPRPDSSAKGALVGLTASHGRVALLKAVLEGTAFEMEAIRRSAEALTGERIERIVAAGGGTKNRHWLQIKADVSGYPVTVSPVAEAAVLGAALVAGLGCGLYGDVEAALEAARQGDEDTVQPDAERHRQYQRLYEQGYLALQDPVRAFSHLATTDD
jgi:sugar (pentulose or hexulose) kinase